MTFNWASMQTALKDVFGESTGISFIWDDSLKRIPRAPIGVLSLGQSMPVGRDGHRYTFRDSDISLDLYGYRELTISVQIRARLAKAAPSSRVLAEKARLALANPIYREKLRESGLVFVETHPLLNLDFGRLNRKELRSAFDVVFRLMLNNRVSQSIEYFDQIAISENFK